MTNPIKIADNPAMLKLLREIYARRELLGMLVLRNIKIRYKNSALGFFWTLLGPVFLILIYTIFLRILRFYKAGDPAFLPMLVVGIIVWQFLSMCLGDSLQTIIGNANLVKKTAFPRIILPLAMVTANLVNFLFSSVVLLIYLQIAGMPLGNTFWLPVVLLTHFALCLGMGLIISCLNVFFRDTEHILSVAMLAWFLLTPVIYPFENIPARFQEMAFLNPMTGIVTAYRSVLMFTQCPRMLLLGISFVVSWVVLLLGIAIFQKLQARFAEEL